MISQEELGILLKSGKPLNVKLGVDPTSVDLHLGHAVVLRMLRQFQELGHKTFLVIGDFTASIGDPAGVNKTRPVLTSDEIRSNMVTYLDQAKLILDTDKTEIVFNSSWLKEMKLGQFICHATQITVNNLIEREDFANRLKDNQPLSLHELLYPVVQALDSVELKADVEIGGWDQRLNLLTARELQKKLGQKPEVLILMKALIGTDGAKKMSKSQNNYIGLTETPNQIIGKIMSLKDDLIAGYAELAAGMDEFELRRLGTLHPKEAKLEVAKKIAALYHGDTAAERAAEAFEETFSSKKINQQLVEEIIIEDPELPLIQAVTKSASVSSSEARRLIEQGGVRLEDQTSTNPNQSLAVFKGPLRLQVGKRRFFLLRFKR